MSTPLNSSNVNHGDNQPSRLTHPNTIPMVIKLKDCGVSEEVAAHQTIKTAETVSKKLRTGDVRTVAVTLPESVHSNSFTARVMNNVNDDKSLDFNCIGTAGKNASSDVTFIFVKK